MSNPTRSASRGDLSPAAGPRKVARKLRKYKAPIILTYTDEHFLRELGPAKASTASRKHV